MWRATWRSLVGHKLRLALSTLAITLAVAFVSGSLVFTNLLNAAFTNILKGTLADVNVALTGTYNQSLTGPVNQEARLTPVNLTAIGGVPGVASVTGVITVFDTYATDSSGRVIGTPGAMSVTSNWFTAPAADGGRGIVLRSGHEPREAGEIVVDPGTLEKSGHQLGDTMRVQLPKGTIDKTIVGTADWGDAGGSAGASYLFLTTPEMQHLFADDKDVYLVGWVTAKPGEDADTLATRVAGVLPSGFEAVSARAASEAQASVIGSSLSFLTTFLLVFAGIAVLVASFLIVNTFTILVAQRGRELALLRAVGAKRRQVRASVLAEALVVGVIAASVGLVLGLGLAWAIKAFFAQIGFDLGTIAPTLTWQAVAASYLVGVVVTVVAALVPATTASRMPPVVAMTGELARPTRSIDRSGVAGVIALVAGVVLLVLGGWSGWSAKWYLVGIGAVLALVGTALGTPLLGRPIVLGLGRLFRRTNGQVGVLAERNALRSPRRLAATASALTVGLTLVTTVAVLGSSASATIRASVEEGLRGDLQISSVFGTPFPQRIADDAGAVSGVGAVHWLKTGQVTVNGDRTNLTGMLPDAFDKVIAQTMVEGRFPGAGEAAISDYRANRSGWKVGDSLTVTGVGGEPATLRIVGRFENPAGVRVGGIVVSEDELHALTPVDVVSVASVNLASGADAAAVRDSLTRIVEAEPNLRITDTAQWADQQVDQVSGALNLLYALLGLALVIAVLGIVNTLALAVIERTREIGLMRAIGLTRRQLRWMVTLEAVTIAVVGSGLGVLLGLLCGVVVRQAASADGLSRLAIPWLEVVVFVLLAGAVGIIASVWPARRAARLDVLAAIATD